MWILRSRLFDASAFERQRAVHHNGGSEVLRNPLFSPFNLLAIGLRVDRSGLEAVFCGFQAVLGARWNEQKSGCKAENGGWRLARDGFVAARSGLAGAPSGLERPGAGSWTWITAGRALWPTQTLGGRSSNELELTARSTLRARHIAPLPPPSALRFSGKAACDASLSS